MDLSLCCSQMSRVMRKPTFCICENKDADQLRGNREADQRLCFRYIDSTIPLLSKSKFKPFAIFCSCTAWLMSDLVGNQNAGFLMARLKYARSRLSWDAAYNMVDQHLASFRFVSCIITRPTVKIMGLFV